MKLYEATNGYMGNSYVRCLVWANDEGEAMRYASKAFKEDGQSSHNKVYWKDESYWMDIELELILDSDVQKEPMYTEVTD